MRRAEAQKCARLSLILAQLLSSGADYGQAGSSLVNPTAPFTSCLPRIQFKICEMEWFGQHLRVSQD